MMFRSFTYLVGAIGYVIVPLLVLFALKPTPAALVDVIAPKAPDRRLVLNLLLVPLLLPPVVNLVSPHRLTSLWTIPNWTLLPVVLLASPLILVTHAAVARIVAVALALPVVMILAAPAVAFIGQQSHRAGNQLYYRALAAHVLKTWQHVSDRPLRLVGGDADVVEGVIFYLPRDAVSLENHLLNEIAGPNQIRMTGDGTGPRVASAGIVLICKDDEKNCVEAIDGAVARFGGYRTKIELRRSYLGIMSAPGRYIILAIPPER
jgi:hypothetical protein